MIVGHSLLQAVGIHFLSVLHQPHLGALTHRLQSESARQKEYSIVVAKLHESVAGINWSLSLIVFLMSLPYLSYANKSMVSDWSLDLILWERYLDENEEKRIERIKIMVFIY